MAYADPEAQREYRRRWLAKRRSDWFDAHGPCANCGSWDSLELDHVDPADKVDHRIWSWSERRRLAELAKCQVLCGPCHKAKTVGDVTRVRGERVASSKLTDDMVRQIRYRFANGETKRALARAFGVNEKGIRLLLKGETWAHVT